MRTIVAKLVFCCVCSAPLPLVSVVSVELDMAGRWCSLSNAEEVGGRS